MEPGCLLCCRSALRSCKQSSITVLSNVGVPHLGPPLSVITTAGRLQALQKQHAAAPARHCCAHVQLLQMLPVAAPV